MPYIEGKNRSGKKKILKRLNKRAIALDRENAPFGIGFETQEEIKKYKQKGRNLIMEL